MADSGAGRNNREGVLGFLAFMVKRCFSRRSVDKVTAQKGEPERFWFGLLLARLGAAAVCALSAPSPSWPPRFLPLGSESQGNWSVLIAIAYVVLGIVFWRQAKRWYATDSGTAGAFKDPFNLIPGSEEREEKPEFQRQRERRAGYQVIADLAFASAMYWSTGAEATAGFMFYMIPILLSAHEFGPLDFGLTFACVIAGFTGIGIQAHFDQPLGGWAFWISRAGFLALFALVTRWYVQQTIQQRRRFVSLFLGIQSGISVLGKKGEILRINKAQLDMNPGLKEAATSGKPVADKKCWEAYHHGQKTPCPQCPWYGAEDPEIPKALPLVAYTNDLQSCNDGEAMRLYQVMFGPLLDQPGEFDEMTDPREYESLSGVVESVMDITDTVFEMPFLDSPSGIPLAVIDVRRGNEGKGAEEEDKFGKILYANKQKRINSPETEVGARCYEVWAGRKTICLRCPVEIMEREERAVTGLTKAIDPSNHTRYALVTAVPIKGSKGKIIAALEVVTDVTSRVRLTEMAQDLMFASTEEALWDALVKRTAEMIKVPRSVYVAVDADERTGKIKRAYDMTLEKSNGGPYVGTPEIRKLDFSSGRVMDAFFEKKKPLVLTHAQEDLRGEVTDKGGFLYCRGVDCKDIRLVAELVSFHTILIVPVIFRDNLIGMLTAESPHITERRAAPGTRVRYPSPTEQQHPDEPIKDISEEDIIAAESAATLFACVFDRSREAFEYRHALRHQVVGWPRRLEQATAEVERYLSAGDQEGASRSLSLLREASRRCRFMLDSIVTAEHIALDEVKMQREHVDLRRICEQVVSQLSALADSRQIQISVRADQDVSPIILADRANLELILHHLLINALDFVARDGSGRVEVDISLADGGRLAILRVRDNGAGMRKWVQDHLFEKNFSTRKHLGSGLYIVKGLADLHNWRIQIHSVINEGTEFEIRIPILRSTRATG